MTYRRRNGHRSKLPWVSFALLTLMLVVQSTQSLNPAASDLLIDQWGWGGTGSTAKHWLTLLTALFIHVSWLHLFANVTFLILFGPVHERATSHLSLLLVFIAGGAGANVFGLLGVSSETSHILVGSSGAVSAVVGAELARHPKRLIGLYLPLGLVMLPIHVRTWSLTTFWVVGQFAYSLAFPTNSPVNWRAHLAGVSIGLLYGALLRIGRR